MVPESLRIKSPVSSVAIGGWKLAERTGKLFLNERLHEANRRVRELNNERRCRELTVKRMLTAEDFDQLQRTSNAAAEKALND